MNTISFDSTNSGKLKPLLEVAEQKLAWAWLGSINTAGKPTSTKYSLQDYSYMVPNGTQLAGGGARRAIYMKSLKAQGLKPGVSDLVIAYPVGIPYNKNTPVPGPAVWHGAYIEMKRVRSAYSGPAAVKAALRPEQKDWLKLMNSVGYWVCVAYGFEDFRDLVELYLSGKSPRELDFLS